MYIHYKIVPSPRCCNNQGCQKGDGCFKILQKEIGGIQICAVLLKYIFGGPKLHLGQKRIKKKKLQTFFIFIGFFSNSQGDFFENKIRI